jgi:hypothetical protein
VKLHAYSSGITSRTLRGAYEAIKRTHNLEFKVLGGKLEEETLQAYAKLERDFQDIKPSLVLPLLCLVVDHLY